MFTQPSSPLLVSTVYIPFSTELILHSQDYVFDRISEEEADTKAEPKSQPKSNSGKVVTTEPVTTQTRAPDSDEVHHITYRDVKLFFNLN